MLRWLNVVVLLFFVPRFSLAVYEVLNIENEFSRAKMQTMVQLLETFTMTLLLFVYRPRRRWPDLFWVGVGDANGRNRNGVQSDGRSAPELAQVKTTVIDNNLVFGRDQLLR